MNTNQDTTLTNQDIANVIAPTAFRYIPEYDNDFSYFNSMEEIKRDDHYLVTRLWDESQVLRFIEITTKASEQRIQELEANVHSWKLAYEAAIEERNQAKHDEIVSNLFLEQIKASNNQLREALNYLDEAFDSEMWNCERCGHAEETKTMDSAIYLKEFLASNSTTTKSLAQHDNLLIDKVIKILSDNGIYSNGIIGKDILKLKVTP